MEKSKFKKVITHPLITDYYKDGFSDDIDKYYADHDNGKVAFKGFETMDRGLLENYKKE